MSTFREVSIESKEIDGDNEIASELMLSSTVEGNSSSPYSAVKYANDEISTTMIPSAINQCGIKGGAIGGEYSPAPVVTWRWQLEPGLSVGHEVDLLLQDLRATPEAAARFARMDVSHAAVAPVGVDRLTAAATG
jgi:hypothetical protein